MYRQLLIFAYICIDIDIYIYIYPVNIYIYNLGLHIIITHIYIYNIYIYIYSNNYPDRKNNSDQTYRCPRDWRLRHNGEQLRAHLKPFNTIALIWSKWCQRGPLDTERCQPLGQLIAVFFPVWDCTRLEKTCLGCLRGAISVPPIAETPR